VAAMPRSVVRLPDGAILLRMTDSERAILRALVDDLHTIVGDETPAPGLTDADGTPDGESSESPGPVDPVLDRLYPDVRPEDAAWSAAFRDLVRGDLDEGRRRNIAVVRASLEARTVDDRQAEAWLHVLNDVRLVMGTRLEVTEEDEQTPFDPEDTDAAARIVYAYAGLLEEQFVDVLAEALPEPDEDVGPDEASSAD
jgi:hypothetical protein